MNQARTLVILFTPYAVDTLAVCLGKFVNQSTFEAILIEF